MIIGHPVGNDYDLAARFLAKYLVRHIPGEPTIIAQNMPQAASITAANFLYGQAPRDGTVFGSFSRNVPSQARMGQPNVSADPRLFNWLGATSLPSRVCVAYATAPVKTAADLFTRELIVAGSGAGSSLSILPTFGSKKKLPTWSLPAPPALNAAQLNSPKRMTFSTSGSIPAPAISPFSMKHTG